MMLLYGHLRQAGAAESLIWLEPKHSGFSTEKLRFRKNFCKSFALSPKFFCKNKN
jgi:hypothetical protein